MSENVTTRKLEAVTLNNSAESAFSFYSDTQSFESKFCVVCSLQCAQFSSQKLFYDLSGPLCS